MGKDAKRSSRPKTKKEHKSSSSRRRSSSSSSDSGSGSSSSTDDSRSPSRSRSRSASRSHRKHSRSSKHRSSRSRSRSADRDRDRKKKGSKRKTSRSRSRSRDRDSDRRKHAKHEPPSRSRSRSRSRSVKREGASASASASAPTAAPPALSSSDLRRIKAEEKARLKASETPAERDARRAAKKALKAIHKSGGAAALPGMLGSSASATAGFVDSQAAKPFVWKKKYEVAIASGLAPQILSREELAAKQRALAKEIEEIKARKIARADERAQMDALRDQMSRDAEAETIEGWEEKEEEFHRTNAALRTEMRINSGREKCVDILAKNRALFRKLVAGPTDDEKQDHPEWRGATLDPALAPAKDLELTEPHLMFLSGDLPWRDLEYLARDIQGFLDLDVREDREYWTACAKLCGDALKKQKAAAFAPGAVHNYSNRGGGRGGQQPGPTAVASSSSADGGPSVRDDIALMLRGKSLSELEDLEREIHLVVTGSPQASAALTAMADGLDHTYWESVSRELAHFKAVAYLREFHEALLAARLKDLQHFVREEEKAEREEREKAYAERVEAAGGGAAGAAAVAAADAEASKIEDGLQGLASAEEDDLLDFEPVLIPHEEFDAAMEDTAAGGAAAGGSREDSGSFSPTLEAADEVEDRSRGGGGVRAVDPEADARELAEARRAVAEQKQREMEARAKMEAGSAVAVAPASASSAAAAASSDSDSAFLRESSRALGADEVRLSTSFAIPEQTYWWGDKFRPRKPRFFNRVKTGFEWNKYNGTHYDKENPPPKIVQGYKFNIFYPDLIDPSVPPRYRLEPDPGGNPDFVILRFMAGPPYEDVAFKIVRKEWEYSFKRGYKCVFDRGVLCLYFNFRRYFYRR